MNDLFYRTSAGALPRPAEPERAARGLEAWDEAAQRLEDPERAAAARALAQEPEGRDLLEAIFGNSAFLGRAIVAEPAFVLDLLTLGPDAVLSQLHGRLKGELALELDRKALMSGLRRERRRLALLVALADITGHWPLERVTEALSDFADRALDIALGHLLRKLAARGRIALGDELHPERDCGYAILAMGKMGARELNYSSDIDLIVIYDPQKCGVRDEHRPGDIFERMTRDLVGLMEERTVEGQVARVDLRLRPDPGAMPVAIAYGRAMAYYESTGQNWERAAMIKARAAAGDLEVGRAFLRELRPFVWRKNLDFWAINDIHSIKRQIVAHRGGGKIALAGHNIKLGRGGIREIEFFAQTQQLIYGGRDPSLRTARTVEALAALARAGRIDAETAEELGASYRYLRRLEHRLQMVEDQQTHSLPADDEGLRRTAVFLGYQDATDFAAATFAAMRAVETRYAELFEDAPTLSGPGNLVFTGGEPDPDTLATLAGLGYGDGAAVFHLVRSWHHGRYRSTRSTRARELLTELMPALIEAFARTPDPDGAFKRFDGFLAGLPAGVQLFSLLVVNPALFELLADIMGSAPALADHLSRNPGLMDAVLSPAFFGPSPSKSELRRTWTQTIGEARDYQDSLDFSRRWINDARFQIGVNLLRRTIDVDEAGRGLSDITDIALEGLYDPVVREFTKLHGSLPGGGLAVLALGKYGSREMTTTSDLDLIFLYDAPDGASASDGAKPLEPSVYYMRLSQRFISALTAPTAEGKLCEIDMRLRPSGDKGPIATTLAGFLRYHERDAWTWERMALTRARVVVGEADFTARIDEALQALLLAPRDPDTLLTDVAEMRARIEREFPARSAWSMKHLRGGLVDLDFLAQYLQLRHAAEHPEVLHPSTQEAFGRLAEAGLLDPGEAARLSAATRLMRRVQLLMRLTVGDTFDEESAPEGLKTLLARACEEQSFLGLRGHLLATAEGVYDVFRRLIEEPAAAARLSASPEPPPGPAAGTSRG